MEFKEKYTSPDNPNVIAITKNHITHQFLLKQFTSNIIDILKIIIEEDQLAFKTLKQTGQFIKKPEEFNPRQRSVEYTNEFIAKSYSGESDIFKKITEKGGLVGI